MPEAAPAGHARPVPVSTYRLQLTSGFGFAEVADLAGYLASLGVTHVYLSPILQAAPGSAHGYDVVDHSRISADLGGEDAFRAMAAQLHQHGLGVVVDVVPNHMAIPVPESLNRQLWSVLREGTASPYADWFDVDWAAQDGRLLLPILGGPVPDCLGDLTVGPAGPGEADQLLAGEPVLRYFGHVLPLRPGTAGLALTELLDAQHYRLAHWRDAATELNWRRFFDISSLIAIQVEHAGVFATSHRLLLSLLGEGLIDGLRVDHPDGLADPRGYLRRLAAASGGAWVVTEKILTGEEQLPADWPCAGTTGYDSLGMVGGLFLDPAGAKPLTAAYQDFTGGPATFADAACPAKRETAGRALAAEVSRLARLCVQAGPPVLAGLTSGEVHVILGELLAAFGVYRAYVVPGEPASPTARATVAAAAAGARTRLPPHLHPALAAIADLVLGRGTGGAANGGAANDGAANDGAANDGTAGDGAARARAGLIVAFQQTCGPVMAKGVEDTAFYRWPRLAALTEVGWEPDRLGVSPAEFHAFAARLAQDWPATMTTLSTHDTKRQEDVRARLAVLAEIPAAWAEEAASWHDRAAALTGGQVPEPGTEYLMWQTLVGAWPISPTRTRGYLRKAMREAKTATSWTDPDHGYEAMVADFADVVLGDEVLTRWIAGFAAAIGPAARVNSLGAKLVQLTMPGVADVYQGCELAGFSLVDPDNRRPVDFDHRQWLLAVQDGTGQDGAGQDGTGPPPDPLDVEKLLVTSAALRLRRAHPDWYAGRYQPLTARGPAAAHVLAFVRGGQAVTVVTRLPQGLAAAGGWADTVLPLPPGQWQDLLTGTTYAGPQQPMPELCGRYPVALLVPHAAAPSVAELITAEPITAEPITHGLIKDDQAG